ncbi:MAG: Flp pilus assembly protein CpaB [Hyphomicrobiales bacterium]
MKPARIAIIGVALAAGLVAAYLSSGIREQGPAPQVAAEPEKIAATEVLVAATDLALGMKLGVADLKWLPWPTGGLGPGLILKKDAPDAIAQTAGSMVREGFLANEPVRKEKLIRADSGFLAAILPGGKRAFAISIDPQGTSSAGTLILPNDHVDVVQIYKDMGASKAAGTDIFSSQTLLQNIRVLAIGPNIEEKNGERVAVGQTATLELDPQQVMIVALAARTGSLTLALRSVVDAAAVTAEVAVPNEESQYSVIRYGVATTIGFKK